MSIKYKMVLRRDNINPEGEKKIGYYPQIVRTRTVDINELASMIAKSKRLNTIETKANIEMLFACIEKELLDGNNVCLDGFGTFSVTAKCTRRVADPNEIRAESIELKKIAFTPSKQLRSNMKVAEFSKLKANK